MPIYYNKKLRLAAVMSVLALTLSGGCGGPSATNVDPWVAPPVDYYKLLSDDTSDATSIFDGVGIRDTNEVLQASGTFEHNTGALTYTDGTHPLNSPTGFSDGTTAFGDTGDSLENRSAELAGTYEYVMFVDFIYPTNADSVITTGFAGITTDAVHVPVSGSAIYIGDASGIINSGDPFNFTDWVSTTLVNFGAGSVNVTLNPMDGLATNGSFDTVQITGMTIDGNTFTGGELETLIKGDTVNPIGTITSTDSLGMFFGWDSDGGSPIPDEVGGVSVIAGSTGEMLFLFVGD